MAVAFKVLIVTPEALVLDTTATEAQIPAHDGSIGILHLRAPLLVELGAGFLTLKSDTGQRRFYLAGGFAQVKDDVLTLLADEAYPEDKVTPELIAKYRAKAEALEAAMEEQERELKRAAARERLKHEDAEDASDADDRSDAPKPSLIA